MYAKIIHYSLNKIHTKWKTFSIVLHIYLNNIQVLYLYIFTIIIKKLRRNTINSHANDFELHQITYKTEELLEAADNRFKITIKVANRAKRRKYEDIDIIDDPMIKPVIRAILEMVDEITQTEIIGE